MTTDHLPRAGTVGFVADAPDEPRGSSAPRRRASTTAGRVWSALRPGVLRLHFYAGVFVGPFIVIAAFTGLLYTATPAIEHVVYAHELRVTPGTQRLPIGEQVAAARAAHPEGTISQVRPAATPNGTTRVVLAVPGLPQDDARTVFVNPYTGAMLGTLTTYGEWLPVRTWVDALHRNLHLGEFGRWYSELAASWLWVVVLGGVALWVGDRLRAPRSRLRTFLAPAGHRPGRRRVLSWHATLGVWTLVGLLFLSATGLTWSEHAGDNISALRAQLSMSTPLVDTAPPGNPTTRSAPTSASTATRPSGPAGDAAITKGAGIEGALRGARAAGLRDPLQLIPPTGAGAAWEVDEVKRSWPLQQDAVALDSTTGDVTHVVRFASWPLAAKLAEWGVDAHMGLLFGVPNLLALAALAAGTCVLVVWGYVLWWKRRPTRAPHSLASWGRAPRRGALGSLPVAAVLGLAALALGLGLLFPLLGLSLLLFLVVDILAGFRPASGEAGPGRGEQDRDASRPREHVDRPAQAPTA